MTDDVLTVDRYAVAGNPVAHSLSPRIHGMFAAATGQRISYDRLLVPEGTFAGTAQHFFSEGGCGLNVTLPCKGDAYRWLGRHRCTGTAVESQAVNTIVRTGTQLQGFNTDGVGLIRDFDHLGIRLEGAAVLVLGAGGAVQGILPELIRARPAAITIANRSPKRAERLVRLFAAPGVKLWSCGLDALTSGFDLVINGTSASLSGETMHLPEIVVRDAWCYDMVYGVNAKFHQWAAAMTSRRSHDGLGMLIEQAAEAFWLWRGVRPDTAPVRRALDAGATGDAQ